MSRDYIGEQRNIIGFGPGYVALRAKNRTELVGYLYKNMSGFSLEMLQSSTKVLVLHIVLPCGSKEYPTMSAIPEHSEPCGCGEHWFIRYDDDVTSVETTETREGFPSI